jgi:hypothetical protein
MFYFLIENKNQCLLERHFDHTIEKVEIQDQNEFIKHLENDQPELIYLVKLSKSDHLIKKIKNSIERKKIKYQEEIYVSSKDINLIRDDFLTNIQTSEDDAIGPIYSIKSASAKSKSSMQAKRQNAGNRKKLLFSIIGFLVIFTLSSVLYLYLYQNQIFKSQIFKKDEAPDKTDQVNDQKASTTAAIVSKSDLSHLKAAFEEANLDVEKRSLNQTDIPKSLKPAFSNFLYGYTIERVDDDLAKQLIEKSTEFDQNHIKHKPNLIIRLDLRKQEEATLPCDLDYTKRLSILCLINEASKDTLSSPNQIIEFNVKLDTNKKICEYAQSSTNHYAIRHTLLKYCEAQDK